MGFLKIYACILILSLSHLSYAETDLYAVSADITTLYRSARAVISDNQALINDASKGDKGLSAEAVVEKTLENYRKAVNHDLDMTTNTDAKEALLQSVSEVMEEAQDLINEPDKGFKGFLPAIFARQVATKFSQKMEGKMQIKLTAPKDYVRNRANRPDKWESNVIESMFRDTSYEKGKPYAEQSALKGKNAYRYILPEYYGPSCLGCHGEPKGSLDITGGKKEGGVLGELGGAISLIIFN
ncbi:DUF3365 domain-containing protein [Hahella aquimaris]|uniref:Tll0287-like domain-containing protein n=1 Tax=Hahella sp. HNIBRBA332 TaxID=3015983 RepID=UPI00273AD6C9|nr:DUF3365 domain-containing protein [Hahella sp. HNIBRBA332]WLQ13295.1 DUF3365 domain-containing protein [Hahella sp. HNIBRBA332]